MSLDMNVYCKELSDELIPLIEKKLNDFDMTVNIHPEFSFNEHSGFLPFKFKLNHNTFPSLQNKELLSGFELYIDEFDLDKEISNLTDQPSFFQKFFGSRKKAYFESEKIDTILKDCKKIIYFNWSSADTFEARFAILTSAIITELTNGLCCYPADNIWYETAGLTERSYNELKAYENAIAVENIKYHIFEAWT